MFTEREITKFFHITDNFCKVFLLLSGKKRYNPIFSTNTAIYIHFVKRACLFVLCKIDSINILTLFLSFMVQYYRVIMRPLVTQPLSNRQKKDRNRQRGTKIAGG